MHICNLYKESVHFYKVFFCHNKKDINQTTLPVY